MIYNYIIFIVSKFLYIFLPKGKTRLFNTLIRLSKNNWRYSYYGVKVVDQKFNDLTYKLSLGGGYGNYTWGVINVSRSVNTAKVFECYNGNGLSGIDTSAQVSRILGLKSILK